MSKDSPMRVGKLQGGLNIFNNVAGLKRNIANNYDDSVYSASRADLDTIDGASLAEQSSDDDMGDYDYNIETNRIVKTRHRGSIKASSRRSIYSRRTQTVEPRSGSIGFKNGKPTQDLIKMLIKRESKRKDLVVRTGR